MHAAISAPVIDARILVAFHLQWTVRGFRIRESVDDDVLLAAALRRLAPSYEGRRWVPACKKDPLIAMV